MEFVTGYDNKDVDNDEIEGEVHRAINSWINSRGLKVCYEQNQLLAPSRILQRFRTWRQSGLRPPRIRTLRDADVAGAYITLPTSSDGIFDLVRNQRARLLSSSDE
ncbi:hypothetical protein TNCV_1849161 [Trichonephila clavipes]|nr:hypothetical protein TNCV_1849161 [Trichonephila clavipes]